MKSINPAESTGFLVSRVAHYLTIRVQEFLDEAGIAVSAEEIAILTMLAHLDKPNRMTVLAERHGKDATTLSRQIDRLERAGLVQRERDPEDGRAVVVTVTGAGVRLVKRTMPMTLALRRRAMQGIPERDEKVMKRALKQMLVNLRSEE